VPAALALAVAVPAAAILLVTRFDGLYGQDPFAYYDYAVGPLRDQILRLASPPPFAWPPGYPLLIAVLSLALGTAPLVGQLVSIAAGSAAPVFTYLFAREVSPNQEQAGTPPLWSVPVLAGTVVAVTGQLWQSSIVVMSDTTGLAFATAAAWALARYARVARRRWLVLAAVTLACAISTRWIYGIVAAPFLIYAFLTLRRRPVRAAIGDAVVAAVAGALIVGPVVVPAVVGLATGGLGSAPFAVDLQVYSWDPLNSLRSDFDTVDGHLEYATANGAYYAILPWQWFFLTPLLAPAAVLGAWIVARRRDASGLLLLLGWVGSVYAFHAGAPWQNVRFGLAYLPPLAVLVAIGAVRLESILRPMLGRVSRGPMMLGIALMVIGAVVLTRGFVERKQDDLALVRWVQAQAPSDARLLTFDATLTFRHYARIETVDISDLTPRDLPPLLADGTATFVLLDVPNIERQWTGYAPADDYHWLRDGPGLVQLAAHGRYTLFAVKTPGL
jgi:4-amino-4-deoxy-L-arabinose transferase-like glycosyltransferase